MHYYIITGGPIIDDAAGVIGEGIVICADGGTDYARKHSVIPDKVVGDLDSISEEGIRFIEDNNIPLERFKVEKDWTDTEIALDSVPAGSDITIICPLDGNGRLDHIIGNIQLAAGYAPKYNRIVLTDGLTSVYMLSGRDSISVDISGYAYPLAVSLVPLSFGSSVTDVTTEGLYYSLEGGELIAGKTFSFCNHPSEGASKIGVSIGEGILAVIVTKEA